MATADLIALAFGAYGIYLALYLVPLLIGVTAPLLAACLAFETAAAFAAAISIWRRAMWAPIAVLVVGAAVVVTQLVEGPVLGLIATVRAVTVGVVALLVTFAMASIVGARRRI